jgi:hypothetical protein
MDRELKEVLLPLIHQAMEEGRVVALHVEDQELGSFFCGRVASIEDDVITLRYINDANAINDPTVEWGEFGLSEICWIKADTPYLQGLAVLFEDRLLLPSGIESFVSQTIDAIRVGLMDAQQSGEVVRMTEKDGSHLWGQVMRLTDEFVLMQLIQSEDGALSGEMLVRLDQVSALRRGSVEEAAIGLLHLRRYGFE